MSPTRLLIAICVLPLFTSCGEVENIEVAIDQPVDVREGEQFTTIMTVSNTGSVSQELFSIDIADTFLEGVMVVASSPPFRESTHVPIDNTQSYSFNSAIGPGQTLDVKFTMQALYPGVYRGDVDFCINDDYTFVSYPIGTVIN